MSELDRIEEKGDISDQVYGSDEYFEEEYREYDDMRREKSDKIFTTMLDRYSFELKYAFY